MKKKYISPEVNVVKIDAKLMSRVGMTMSGEQSDLPTVDPDDEIPDNVIGNSKGWNVSFTD